MTDGGEMTRQSGHLSDRGPPVLADHAIEHDEGSEEEGRCVLK